MNATLEMPIRRATTADIPDMAGIFASVAPRMQGRGLGTALLKQTLARADGIGVDAYLENSNPRNLRLYERAGFSVTREIRARGDAPPVYAMRRPASRAEV